MLETFAIASLILASIPAVVAAWNVGVFRRLPAATAEPRPAQDAGAGGVSLLIPARDEERSIGAALEAALANTGIEFEVIVLDDHSTDRTAEIVRAFAESDPRVRLETAPPLPSGWCGKQHACHALSKLAGYELLVFIDADVRLGANALPRIAAEMARRPGLDLLSGFPRQETGTWAERLVLPLISYLILAYLPIRWARRFRFPGFAAGCGQLFIARRSAYEQVGGHGAVRTTLHDGVKLPRAYRRAGFTTDIFDASDLARCRMYRGFAELWRGLTKNSVEGLGAPGAIGVWTALLIGGSVLPPMVLAAAWLADHGQAMQTAGAATALVFVTRAMTAVRVGDSVRGVLGHPLGVLMLIAIQWDGLIRRLRGVGPQWKGRTYAEA